MKTLPLHAVFSPLRPLVRFRLVAVGLITATLTGCQSLQGVPSNTVQVRFIDAAPDAPGLDVYQNTSGLAFNLEFGTLTSYVPLSAGNSTLLADAAGSRQTLASARQTMTAGRQYTAILGSVGGTLQETLYVDQSTPAPAGQIALRVISQVSRASGLDVYLVPSSTRLPATAPLATNILFGANTGYLNLPAGTYAVTVVPAGTVPVASTTTMLTGKRTAYAPGTVRTVVLIDSPAVGTPGVQAVVAADYDPPSAS